MTLVRQTGYHGAGGEVSGEAAEISRGRYKGWIERIQLIQGALESVSSEAAGFFQFID